jgi:heat shock protein HslJ
VLALLAVPLVTVALAAPDAAALRGTSWEVRALGGERAPADYGDGLRFRRHRVTGYVHCNSIRAPYELSGPELRFGTLASTLAGCDDRAGPRLSLPVAMERTRSYRRDGRRLRLHDARGRTVARFAKVRELAPPT